MGENSRTTLYSIMKRMVYSRIYPKKPLNVDCLFMEYNTIVEEFNLNDMIMRNPERISLDKLERGYEHE
jgi:hypothetical protein